MPLPPVELTSVLLAAILNPVVIVVAVLMGRNADQWQKIPVAGFAAATVGSAVVYVLVRLGLMGSGNIGRAAGGIFIAQLAVGTLWAAAAHWWARR